MKLRITRLSLEAVTAFLCACLLLSGYLYFALPPELLLIAQAGMLVVAGSALGIYAVRASATAFYVGVGYIGLLAITGIIPNLLDGVIPNTTTLSVVKFLRFHIVLVYSVLLGIFCYRSRDSLRFFRWLAPLAFILLIGSTVMTGGTGEDRLGNGAGNAIWYARLVGLNAIFIIFPAFDRRSKLLWRIVRFAIIPLLLVLIAMSGSRGPALAFLIVMFVANVGWLFRHPIRAFGFALCGGIGGWLAYNFASETNRERFLFLFSGNDVADADGGRSVIYQICSKMIGEQPVGYGYGGFMRITDLDYPHNILLESLVEPGLVFSVLFLLPLLGGVFLAVAGLIKPESHDGKLTIPCAICIYAFVNSMVSGDLTSPRLLYICVVFLWSIQLSAVFSRRHQEHSLPMSPTGRIGQHA